MKKIIYIIAIVAALVGGFYALNSYIYNEKQGDGEIIEPYRASLSGEYVCLPHKDTSGPQTLECAFGIRTDAGENYAIDFYLMSQEHRPLSTGERLSANGVVTPIERLSTDHWRKYDVKGIFSVTNSLQILK